MRSQEYHTAADRLQLIPASAKRAGGVQFEIALDRAGASAAEMVSVDVKACPQTSSMQLSAFHGLMPAWWPGFNCDLSRRLL